MAWRGRITLRPQLLLPHHVADVTASMVFLQAGEPFRCPLSPHTKIIHLISLFILEIKRGAAVATACHARIAPSALSVHSPLARVPFRRLPLARYQFPHPLLPKGNSTAYYYSYFTSNFFCFLFYFSLFSLFALSLLASPLLSLSSLSYLSTPLTGLVNILLGSLPY